MSNYEADEARAWRRQARDQYEAPSASEYADPQEAECEDYLDSLIQQQEAEEMRKK